MIGEGKRGSFGDPCLLHSMRRFHDSKEALVSFQTTFNVSWVKVEDHSGMTSFWLGYSDFYCHTVLFQLPIPKATFQFKWVTLVYRDVSPGFTMKKILWVRANPTENRTIPLKHLLSPPPPDSFHQVKSVTGEFKGLAEMSPKNSRNIVLFYNQRKKHFWVSSESSNSQRDHITPMYLLPEGWEGQSLLFRRQKDGCWWAWRQTSRQWASHLTFAQTLMSPESNEPEVKQKQYPIFCRYGFMASYHRNLFFPPDNRTPPVSSVSPFIEDVKDLQPADIGHSLQFPYQALYVVSVS